MKPPMLDDSRLDVAWDACDRAEWDSLLRRAGRSSLEQSWPFGEALRATANVAIERAVIRAGAEPRAMVQAVTRRIAGLAKLVRIARGPLWLGDGLAEHDRRSVLAAIARHWRLARREFLVWLPELADTPESVAAMRACGKRRMVTGYTSAWIDLARSPEALRRALDGKWRNKLGGAERAGLSVAHVVGPSPDLDWLLERYVLFRRERRFLGPSPELIRAFAAAQGGAENVMVLRAFAGATPVAGVLFLRHGLSASYYVGWTSDDGRRLRAHNALLWQGMLALRDDGVAWLDLGGIDAAAPGVARFKLGLGGEVFTLAGTYI